jgi:uncharacterized DUF497 family protein
MKYFNWNPDKNEKLKKERNISFDDVLYYLENGYILDVIDHPNQEKYKGQRIFVINIDNYIYIVPFVENENEYFLKTIIPSRDYTKKYLDGEDKNEKKF